MASTQPASTLAWVLAMVAGCATEVNTLEPEPDDGGSGQAGNTSSSGSAGTGGKSGAGTGGKSTGGKSTGGTASNAFGGSNTTQGGGGSATTAGSTSQGGSGAGSAGMPSAGQSGSGGKASGGSGGSSGATGGGGSSGSGGKASGGSGGDGDHCLAGWRDSGACDTCSTQTQGDKKACANVLDCFIVNDCGPATCAGNTDVCGANAIQQGSAPYPIAQQVYECICQ